MADEIRVQKQVIEQEYLTIPQVAKMLGVSRPMIYEFMKDKESPLPALRLSKRTPRISRVALNIWLEEKIGSGLPESQQEK